MAIDPNLSLEVQSENQAATKSVYDSIKEYFDLYIYTYLPYKDEPVFKAMMNQLIKYWVKYIYEDHPHYFKKLFEEQEIPSELIDTLLVSIGLPRNLISDLSINTKTTLFLSFSDFQRFKSSVKFVKTLGSVFSDRIAVYELYIDYQEDMPNDSGMYTFILQQNKLEDEDYIVLFSSETDDDECKDVCIYFGGVRPELPDEIRGLDLNWIHINPAGKTSVEVCDEIKRALSLFFYTNASGTDILQVTQMKLGAARDPINSTSLHFRVNTPARAEGGWVLKPKPLFIHPEIVEQTDYLKYLPVYNSVGTLLVSEDQLNTLRQNEQIVLPIKSNLLLMDYSATTGIDRVKYIYYGIIISHISNDYMPIYFSDNTILSTQFSNVVCLWFYLVTRYFGAVLSKIPLRIATVFCDNPDLELDLKDIPKIAADYEAVKTQADLKDFFDKWIDPFFSRFVACEEPTLDYMLKILNSKDETLISTILKRLEDAHDEKAEIDILLNDIYSSCLVFFMNYDNEIVRQYSEIFLDTIPLIATDIEECDSYKILLNLKPFHCELITNVESQIAVKDKFNSLLLDDPTYYLYRHELADLQQAGDKLFATVIHKHEDKLPFDMEWYLTYIVHFMDEYVMTDDRTLIPRTWVTSVLGVSDSLDQTSGVSVSDSTSLNDFFELSQEPTNTNNN